MHLTLQRVSKTKWEIGYHKTALQALQAIYNRCWLSLMMSSCIFSIRAICFIILLLDFNNVYGWPRLAHYYCMTWLLLLCTATPISSLSSVFTFHFGLCPRQSSVGLCLRQSSVFDLINFNEIPILIELKNKIFIWSSHVVRLLFKYYYFCQMYLMNRFKYYHY